jgi:catechol 2,3-dioxygenase-like lactoylglutathione lyase family enzyme
VGIADAPAQLAAPNAAGVAMGHLHYTVRDIAANRDFWVRLGGTAIAVRSPGDAVKFADVLVLLTEGDYAGNSEASVLNHIAFRVRTFAEVEAAEFAIKRLEAYPGVGYIYTPEHERVEIFENAALNLTFTQEPGFNDAAAQRHNRPIAVPAVFHHAHLYLPDEGAMAAAKAWYTKLFGGIPGKRSHYEAADLPGVNFNFSVAPRPTSPTKGRMLGHIGFEVVGLEAFCRRLEGMGVTFDSPYSPGSIGIATAFLTDPWGTHLELTEGLRRF